MNNFSSLCRDEKNRDLHLIDFSKVLIYCCALALWEILLVLVISSLTQNMKSLILKVMGNIQRIVGPKTKMEGL